MENYDLAVRTLHDWVYHSFEFSKFVKVSNTKIFENTNNMYQDSLQGIRKKFGVKISGIFNV